MLLLGAIEPWKRPDLALEAVALAARELPELRLTVAGEPLGAEGERLLAELRRRAERPDLRDRVDLRRPRGRSRAPARLGRLPPPLRRARAVRDGRGRGARERGAGGGPGLVRPRRARRSGLRPAVPARRRGGRGARPDGRPEDARRTGAAARARAERDLGVSAMRAAYALLLGGRPGARRPGAGLALVTVLHNSAPELARLLDSLERHLPDAQLVVVDSGSSDDGAELARGWRGRKGRGRRARREPGLRARRSARVCRSSASP